MHKFKKSDTLFILGSGASITDLSAQQLTEIGDKDSIGFNFWLLHELVPTYYVGEFLPNSKRSDVLWKNMAVRADDYSGTPVIFKYSRAFEQHRQNIPKKLKEQYLTNHLSIPGVRELSLRSWLKVLDRTGLLTGKWLGELVPYRQASLSWLLVFALRLNYKKIIFCGVDLNSPNYFYDADTTYCSKNGLTLPPAEFTSPVHPSNDNDLCRNGIPISRVIEIFNQEVLPKHKVQLYIGSEKSALFPMLPLYPWQGNVSIV